MSGRSEPDRYVLFSNHYDAWVKVTHSSFTVIVLEVIMNSPNFSCIFYSTLDSYFIELKKGFRWKELRNVLKGAAQDK